MGYSLVIGGLSINCVYITETYILLDTKSFLNQFHFIDQNSCYTQANDCLHSDMFYFDLLHLLEKFLIVL